MAIKTFEQLGGDLYSLVPNIPSEISGAPLWELIFKKTIYINTYTGLNCGSPQIAERFQPALINLAAAELLRYQALQGVKVSNVSLGDFSIGKNSSSPLADASTLFQQRGEDELRILGFDERFYVAY